MSDDTENARGLGPVSISGASHGDTLISRYATRDELLDLKTQFMNDRSYYHGKYRELSADSERFKADSLVQERKVKVLSLWLWLVGATAVVAATFSSVVLSVLLNQ